MAIIPARYASTRFPGKPLVDICGKTLLCRVWEAASTAKLLDAVIIATDDSRIADECEKIGAKCIMTPSELPSGSDRVNFAYEHSNYTADLIINLQGDEPLITGELLDTLIGGMLASKVPVGTFIKPITDQNELFDTSCVKVVKSQSGRAMYFSRSTIPFVRGAKTDNWLDNCIFYKHIGIYAYTPDALAKFVSFPPTLLEKSESLEQLRLLEHDIPIECFETNINLIGVDTPEDHRKVVDYFSSLANK